MSAITTPQAIPPESTPAAIIIPNAIKAAPVVPATRAGSLVLFISALIWLVIFSTSFPYLPRAVVIAFSLLSAGISILFDPFTFFGCNAVAIFYLHGLL